MLTVSHISRLSPLLILRMITPAIMVVIMGLSNSAIQLSSFSLVFFFIVFAVYRFEPTNIWIAFTIPWFLIIFFSVLPISDYSREIGVNTVQLIVLIVVLALFILPSKGALVLRPIEEYVVKKKLLTYIFIGYLLLAVLNLLLAGYVPIIRSLVTGDSGYMDFGVKGLYGFYNAFANALGLTAFFLWITKGDKFYRFIFFTVLFLFLIFMTRQNIISLLVEVFVVYNYTVRKFSTIRLVSVIVITLLCFGVLGDFRLGKDIGDLARIKDEYSWMPTAVIWLYSYSYFNILNLDNAVELYSTPVMDLSSVSRLIPSFLRPEIDDPDSVLEVSSFTVGTFVLPIYRDLGFWALIILFAIFCLIAKYYYKKVCSRNSYEAITSYSVIYFCFLFSFFENFWFYLPVIFQLAFIKLIRISVMKTIAKGIIK